MRGTTNDIFAKTYINYAKAHVLDWTSGGFLDKCTSALEESKLSILLTNQNSLMSGKKVHVFTATHLNKLTQILVTDYISLEEFWPIIYDEANSYLNLSIPTLNGNLTDIPTSMDTIQTDISFITDSLKESNEKEIVEMISAVYDNIKINVQNTFGIFKEPQETKKYLAIYALIANDFYVTGKIDSVGMWI